MPFFENSYRTRDLGLLILRVGLGMMFTMHGYPKLMGGAAAWTEIGGVMKLVGINFSPTAWGFMAAAAEAVGGQLLAVGLFFRFTCLALFVTMVMATIMHVSKGDNFGGYSHSVESAFVFLGLLFIGPGRYSVDQLLFPKSRELY
jgi:putative oxidoreductase